MCNVRFTCTSRTFHLYAYTYACGRAYRRVPRVHARVNHRTRGAQQRFRARTKHPPASPGAERFCRSGSAAGTAAPQHPPPPRQPNPRPTKTRQVLGKLMSLLLLRAKIAVPRARNVLIWWVCFFFPSVSAGESPCVKLKKHCDSLREPDR